MIRVFIIACAIFTCTYSLQIKIETAIFARRWNNPEDTKSGFMLSFSQLMKPPTYKVVAKLIANPKYPFKEDYLNWCKALRPYSLLSILKDLENERELLRKLLSVECLDSSLEFNLLYHKRLAAFDIQPFESSSLQPSRMGELFNFNVKKVESETDRTRLNLSSFCLDPNLSTIHLQAPELWKIISVKCLTFLLQSNHADKDALIMSFFQAFRPRKDDLKSHIFMKLVALLAFRQQLSRNSRYKQMCGTVLDRFITFLSFDLGTNDPLNNLSKQLLVSLNVATFDGYTGRSSFGSIFRQIHSLLHSEPVVNATWLLSLTFLLRKSPVVMLTDSSIELLVQWFFSTNPSAEEVCQMFEILNSPQHKALFHAKLKRNPVLFELVVDRCEGVANEEDLPLKSRLNRFLRSKRDFRLRWFEAQSTDITASLWKLTSFLILSSDYFFDNYSINLIFGDLREISGPDIVKLWLQLFLAQNSYYHRVEEYKGKPVIIPSLLVPQRLAYIFGQVLAKVIIYRVPWPFYLPKGYFVEVNNFPEIEQLHMSFSNNLDASILEASSIEFDGHFSALAAYIAFEYTYDELDHPIYEVILRESSRSQSMRFIEGMRNVLDNKFSQQEIGIILGNKLR